MIYREQIPQLIDNLQARRANLYHACQLKDFISYLNVGGIPSRHVLSSNEMEYTEFETDEIDKKNEVWDMVFLNMEDFGHWFSKKNIPKNMLPNPYGPILLALCPTALEEATDVAICLSSAGGMNFDRQREAIGIRDVDRLFLNSIGHQHAEWIKFAEDLEREFDRRASKPEVSCRVDTGVISIRHISYVLVDPYRSGNIWLVDRVKNALDQAEYIIKVKERKRKGRYLKLGELISDKSQHDLSKITNDINCSDELKEWANSILTGRRLLQKNWQRYAKYLHEGTLSV